ncbi:hypothetical protein Acr_15g0012380 [Actinidia rufa]|uniref:Uncharacterized protein n=1 Tax=Actinidia rufa TaxID=165716 RepID=A0A7J0FWU9_9ERIC|nr:hypothetical protein Acr_15g0012380 [Actinidia rufa]
MEEQMRVVCPDNKDLAEFMWKKRQEMAERPKGLSENIEITLHKAYSNVCNSKTPIRTLKEFSQIKYVKPHMGGFGFSGKCSFYFLDLGVE